MTVRSIAAIAITFAMLLAGCVSTTPSQDQANPEEAAHYNVQLGVAYMQQGRLDVALRKLQRALKQDPDLPEAHTAIARLYEQRGSIGLAQEHYRRALDIAPHDPRVLNAYGVFLCRHGQIADSEKYFLQAASDPNYATAEAAYTNAGICLLKIDRKAEAEKDFRRALQVDPSYAEALWQLARLSFNAGKYLESRAFLQRFMERNRNPRPEVLWLAARTEHALGAARQAQKYSRLLISRFPRSAQAALARKMDYDGD